MYQRSFRKLNQAVLADRGRGGARSLKTGMGGASGLPRTPELGKHSIPVPALTLCLPSIQGPLSLQKCLVPPLSPASHNFCVCSSSGTPRDGPAGGTGGSGGPGGSLGSRGRRRKLYSAVPGRSFMAVKSYQAQGEGEISLSKGEKIKGDRVGPGWDRGRGREAQRPPVVSYALWGL